MITVPTTMIMWSMALKETMAPREITDHSKHITNRNRSQIIHHPHFMLSTITPTFNPFPIP